MVFFVVRWIVTVVSSVLVFYFEMVIGGGDREDIGEFVNLRKEGEVWGGVFIEFWFLKSWGRVLGLSEVILDYIMSLR